MNQFTFPVILVLALILLTPGCGGITELRDRYWPTGPSEYEMKVSDKDMDRLQLELVQNIYPVDTELSMLLRRLSVQDDYPPLQWKENLVQDFPWLNGIAVLDTEKNVQAEHPRDGIKQLEYSPLFPRALELPLGQTMLAVEDTPLGPEILLASAVYRDFEIEGLTVVHFDPRSFIADSADPDEIVIICREKVVWPGQYQDLKEEMNEVEWGELTRKKISGTIEVDNSRFFWFARSVGQDWLIYLLKDK
ncbi:hypothetical protein Dthio_PD1305 [Desulfonatronospira thiodismutans ASO3-1]|uniref:Uncharacterized protein n=1 Tax=Desulfonatronospira thiodismutans ASO3-1 TaxID=555779 RepID=D6STF0_9BACT|nr:hypothetical protein [Desulfonatronospira thiodismutans]EFI33966.1 hypothetical protein Dthio_PD1305 [Desulfonatronospira thiodismutans ASO3-1]